jgi:hypothetical protein
MLSIAGGIMRMQGKLVAAAVLFFLVVAGVLLILGVGSKKLPLLFSGKTGSVNQPVDPAPQKADPMRKYLGEQISYDVRLGMFSVGRAEFRYLRDSELNGVVVHLVQLETKVARFRDTELIYCRQGDLLPVRVERQVNFWPKEEKLVEVYDQEEFSLKITKQEGDKQTDQVILKQSPIHNAVLLPYYVRTVEDLQIGWEMKVNLPKQSFNVKLVSVEQVKVPAGMFKAYHFESVPKKFEIWVSADEKRIPLKIKGTSAAGYTLLLSEYRL